MIDSFAKSFGGTVDRNVFESVARPIRRGYVQQGFYYKCVLKDHSEELDDYGLPLQPSRLALSTRLQMPNLPPLLIPATMSEYIRVRVSYVESAVGFFVQLENSGASIVKMSDKIAKYAARSQRKVCNPEAGAVMLARYHLDKCYYRACLISKIGIDTLSLYFLDYGNVETVNIKDVLLLDDPELLSIPPQAIFLMIKTVAKASFDKSQISELLSNQTVGAQIRGVAKDGQAFTASIVMKDVKGGVIDLSSLLNGKVSMPVLPPPVVPDFNDEDEESESQMNEGSNMYRPKYSNFSKSMNERGNSNGMSDRGAKDDRLGDSQRRGGDDRGGDNSRSGGGDRMNDNFRSGGGERMGSGFRSGGVEKMSDSYRNEGGNKWGENHRNGGGDRMNDNYRSGGSDNRDGGGNNYRGGSSDNYRGVGGDNYRSGGGDNYRSGGGDNFRRGGSDNYRGGGSDNYRSGGGDTTQRGWNSGDGDMSDRRRGPSNMTCYNCNKVGHSSRDCTEPRQSSNMTCYNCNKVGHSSRDCTEPRQSSNMTCYNCNKVGHSSRDCTEPREPRRNFNNRDGGWKRGGEERTRNTSERSSGAHSQRNYLDRVEENGAVDNQKFGWKTGDWSFPATTSDKPVEHVEVKMIAASSISSIKFGEFVTGLRSDASDCADPHSFWIHLDSDEEKIATLSLSEIPVSLDKLKTFEKSRVCLALFMDEYYRAEIIEVQADACSVLFVDYGNQDVVNKEDIYVINELLPEVFRTAERMAYHCRMWDLMPVNQNTQFDDNAKQVFSELTIDQLNMCFTNLSSKGVYEVILQTTDGNYISDAICARGYGVPFTLEVGPSLTFYRELDCVRSDDTEDVQREFTVNLWESQDLIDQLSSAISECKTTKFMRVGDLVISLFCECYYRAQIVADDSSCEDSYRVRFLDFGNEDVVKKAELFYLDRDDECLKIVSYTNRQGIRCWLEGVRPIGGFVDSKWSDEAQKCLNNAFRPSANFQAIFGNSRVYEVYPLKVTVEKSRLLAVDEEEAEVENEDVSEKEMVDLASWLVDNGHAELDSVMQFSTINLLSVGQHEYGMHVLTVDAQTIRARPCCFDELYGNLEKAIHELDFVELKNDACVGFAFVDNAYRRAEIVESKESQKENQYLLVDVGTVIEGQTSLFAPNGLGGTDGFLVRTCHKTVVELVFESISLSSEAPQAIMKLIGTETVNVTLYQQIKENVYSISGITLADGRSLTEYLISNGFAESSKEDNVTADGVSEASEAGNENISPKVEKTRSDGDNVSAASFNDCSSLTDEKVVPLIAERAADHVSDEQDPEIQEAVNTLVEDANLFIQPK